jgi:uncharacterized RDD family membrane protein YckC
VSREPDLPESDTALQTTPEENGNYVGLLTRVLSWGVDLLLINLVAIITGLGVALVVAIFPIAKHLETLFAAIAGGVYVLWSAAYFVAFWSTTGQTPGSRVMQCRLVTPNGEKVKPVRAFVRWLAMNLAMIPLPWGYIPIPFKRLGFPDWLAHTRVIDVPQLSISAVQLQRLRQAHNKSRQTSPVSKPDGASSGSEMAGPHDSRGAALDDAAARGSVTEPKVSGS